MVDKGHLYVALDILYGAAIKGTGTTAAYHLLRDYIDATAGDDDEEEDDE